MVNHTQDGQPQKDGQPSEYSNGWFHHLHHAQDAVNWRPGQDIFVATSIWRDEVSNQNEVRTIQQVEQGGRVLVLSAPLQHTHYG